jgi:tetraacyldisaccharide 4'-kinase
MRDRSTSISLSVSDNHDVVILDDGFQDFSIKPNFSILCFNSNQLIGNGFVIPSGPLREDFSSIKRADCIFINGYKNLNFENKIREVNKNAKIFYSKYKVKNLYKFENKNVIAFAGIGNPQNFFELLKENNINIKKTISFPDHHNYSEKDYNSIIAEKLMFTNLKTNEENEQSVLLLTTEKDYCRLDDNMKKSFDYVEVDLEIEDNNEFVNLIKSKL